MEKIQHNYVEVRGLKLHVAEIGTGPVVIFLHGFPEIWYSWRHQMIAAANAGFRAIAPDFRGYGLSQIPAEPEKSTYKDPVDDILGILDAFHFQKVFLVGKDFGARIAHHFAVLYPDRVTAVVTIGVPFLPAGPEAIPLDIYPEGFYIRRFREPGRAEKDFGRFPAKTVVKNVYILFSGTELPIANKDQEIMDMVAPSTPLPSWFTEEDLTHYGELYQKSGFQTALQVPYRVWLEDYGVSHPKVRAPSLLIVGGKDYSTKFGGLGEYVASGKVKEYVPDLEVTSLPEGSHFVQEQFPEEVNKLVINYLNKYV